MNDYVDMYIEKGFGAAGPVSFLSLLFLFMARLLPIIVQAPFLGSRVLPHPVKVAFAITLFSIFMPEMMDGLQKPLMFNLYLVLLLFKEMIVGLFMGFFISIPFLVVQTSGMFIDHQRGGASLLVNDPTIQNQSSPLGTLFNFVLIYIYYYIDAPFLFFDSLMQSYRILPADQFFNPQFFSEGTHFFTVFLGIFGDMVRIATQLAAPGLIAILMTDVFLGIANRLAPQVQITFLGLPLKSLLALAVVCFGWNLFVHQLVKESFIWMNKMNQALPYFSP